LFLLFVMIFCSGEVFGLYGWLAFSIFAASLYSILLHGYPAKEKGSIYRLNFSASIVWVVILFLFNRCKIYLNTEILLWGIAYGITQALFVMFKAKAMNAGPVSVTTLIGNASLLVSVIVSSIVWDEKIGPLDLCGVILLLIGLFLSAYEKHTVSGSKFWKYYVCIFFLLAALVGIIFKGFGKSSVSGHTGDMLLVSAAIMALFYFLVLLATHSWSIPIAKRKFFAYGLAAGVLSCLYNWVNITLSAVMDAVIFFPAFNGGVIVASGALSGLLFKEKFSKRKLCGFALALAAIIMIGVC